MLTGAERVQNQRHWGALVTTVAIPDYRPKNNVLPARQPAPGERFRASNGQRPAFVSADCSDVLYAFAVRVAPE